MIWSFFTDRLNDHHSIIPTILSGSQILVKLMQESSSSYNAFAEFLAKLFQSIVCQTQTVHDRAKIFELLRVASESKAEGTIHCFNKFLWPFQIDFKSLVLTKKIKMKGKKYCTGNSQFLAHFI